MDSLNKLIIKHLPYDKALHYIGGTIIYLLASMVTVPINALCVVALVAIFKEAYDAMHPATHQVEAMDILFTVLGGIVAGFGGLF